MVLKIYTQHQWVCPLCNSFGVMKYTHDDQEIHYCDDCGTDWIELISEEDEEQS